MKQSRTEKAVFAKLSTEKVELGLQQDVLAIYNALQKVVNNMDSDIAKAKKSAILGDSGVKNFYKKAQEIESMAKELGISPKDINLSKLFADIKEFQKSFDSVIKL